MISPVRVRKLIRVPGSLTLYGIGTGVLRSENGGRDWTSVNEGLSTPATGPTGPTYPGLTVADLELDPTLPGVMYAATLAGLYRTEDGGASGWTLLPVSFDTTAVELDPRSSRTVFVGTGLGTIRKSSDGGATWATVASLGGRISALEVLPTGLIFAASSGAGVWRSEDSGATWISAKAGLSSLYVDQLTVGGVVDPILYVSTVPPGASGPATVFRSEDLGRTWTIVNAGLPAKRIFSLAADSFSGQVVFAGTFGAGIYRSMNGGATWEPQNRGLHGLTINDLAFDGSSPIRLYAGTSDGGLFESTDAGNSWMALPSPEYVLKLELDSRSPGALFVGTATGISRSLDGGRTWTSTPAGTPAYSVNSLALDPALPGALYAGNPNFGVFRSMDFGETWSPANDGLPNVRIVDLKVSPGNPSSVFAAILGAGIFRSRDLGRSWSRVLEEPFPLTVKIDPRFPGTLYAGGAGAVYKSSDYGDSWSSSGRGLSNHIVTDVAIDLKVPDRVYATSDAAVFLSVNGGMSWSRIDRGLSNTLFRCIAVHPLEDRVYVGTDFKSVFARSGTVPVRPEPSLPRSLPFRR